MDEIVLPFGKFKGLPLDEVPLTYLDWLVDQEWLKDPLRSEIVVYLKDPIIAKLLEEELTDD